MISNPTSTNPNYWAPIAYSWGGGDPTQGPNCDWFIFPKVSWGNGMATYIGYNENENINF